MTILTRNNQLSIPNLSEYTDDLDRLIHFGSLAWDPVANTVVPKYDNTSTVGLFTITRGNMGQYVSARNKTYPLYPLLARGTANNIDKYVFDSLYSIVEQCKKHVEIEYNSIMFNLARGSVYKHRHYFAEPKNSVLITQVFCVDLTTDMITDSVFRVYSGDESTYDEFDLTETNTLIFNSLQPHEVNTRDDNYHGYVIFENWTD
jgi:hypothetical protein